MNWTGIPCSVCQEPLQEGDDIVVCPECGAPYHRACYQKNGKCVLADKHGAGFEYKRPDTPQAENTHRCRNCGTPNGPTNLFCENCGIPLASVQGEGLDKAAPEAAISSGSGTPPLQGRGIFPGMTDELAQTLTDSGMMPAAKEYDGIATADWVQFIGNSAPYYLFQFDRMDASHRKTSVCWSALLFGPLYFFYRKMWNWAVVSSLLYVLVSIPTMLTMLQSMNLQIGYVLPEAALNILLFVCWLVNWAAQVAFGLFAFYLFRKHAVKKIGALKAAALSDDEYKQRLVKQGGTSRVAVVAILAFALICATVFVQWIGPENFMLYSMYS